MRQKYALPNMQYDSAKMRLDARCALLPTLFGINKQTIFADCLSFFECNQRFWNIWPIHVVEKNYVVANEYKYGSDDFFTTNLETMQKKANMKREKEKEIKKAYWRDGGKSLQMIFIYQTAHTPLKSQGYQVARNEEHIYV